MTDISKTVCDGCGADLTTVADVKRWRIRATVEPIPGGYRAMPPVRGKPFATSKHFCDLKCMGSWCEQETADRCGS